MAEWQPIETVPKLKDGPSILAYGGEGVFGMIVLHWTGKSWYSADGYEMEDHYSHWMPLPAPPVGTKS